MDGVKCKKTRDKGVDEDGSYNEFFRESGAV